MMRPRTSSLEVLSLDQSAEGLPSIKTLAAAHGVNFGMAIKASQLSDSSLTNIIRRESSILVAENDMKMTVTDPSAGVHDFTKADQIAEFAQSIGADLRIHPGIWHSSMLQHTLDAITADWQAAAEDRLSSLLPRYPQATSIDVCLEVLASSGADGSNPTGYREDSPWYIAAGGSSYINFSYGRARVHAPGIELAYCDFGIERNLSIHQAKWAALEPFVDDLCNDGLLDAFAAQCHLFVNSTSNVFSESAFRARLASLRAKGLKVHLSEFDCAAQIDLANERLDYEIAEMGKRVLGVWLEDVREGEQLIGWGVRDGQSWRDNYLNLNQRPTILDINGNPKAVYREVQRLLA